MKAGRILMAGMIWWVAGLAATSARAAPATSCDIVTGASCLWGEGCDCDHDGYVRDNGKAAKYCHFDKCPLDSSDSDAAKLGKPSANNADGDGWTKAFDCDDNDKCVGKTCGTSICTEPKPDPDKDKDGWPASQDCDDGDPNVQPNAGIACCNCKILIDPAKVKALGCTGCPLSLPAKDAGPTDPGADTAGADTAGPDAGAGDTGTVDTAKADAGLPDLVAPDAPFGPDLPGAQDASTADSAAGSEDSSAGNETSDPPGTFLVGDGATRQGPTLAPDALVGGGALPDRKPPPPPGCSSVPVAGTGSVASITFIVLCLVIFSRTSASRRRRILRTVGAGLVLAAATTGCVRVQPWQRERLAHRCMVLGRDAGERGLEQHTLQYREGAAGGFGGGGGGCGCN